MLAVLGHIDAVHGSYYLLMHLVVKFGASEAIVRMPSVLAMTAAAWFTAVIGSELAGPLPGLAGGLLFAISPLTTEYAQDARPFAMVTCLAALASYRFVIFIRTGRTKDAAWYGAALALCGLMNVFGLLLLTGHAATLALSPVRKDRLLRFAGAAATATLVVSPVAWLAATEVAQVSWERRPGLATVASILAALAAAAVVALMAIRPERQPQTSDGTSQVYTARFGTDPLVRLSAPWLIIPVAFLVIGSQISIPSAPGAAAGAAAGSGIWQPRYLLFCFPALGRV
jgi:mannosyltransferase